MPTSPSALPRLGPPTLPRPGDPLRIAFLIYRGNPHCGGQGVYSRHVTRELTELGHEVTMFAGQPWPVADAPVTLEKVGGLDLYRRDNPFRVPWPYEFRTITDLQEFAIMCSAGYPEPYAFSRRIYERLRDRRAEFDLVHDNQCLGSGLLGFVRDGWPFVNTLHHPITVDRDLELDHATSIARRATLRRWYGFLGMQMKVARQLPRHLTVSENSRKDIVAQMGVDPDTLHIVPVGVDQTQFRMMPDVRARAGPPDDDGERGRSAQGSHLSDRSTREGPHRAARRAPRRHRAAASQERGPGADRAARVAGRDRVRQRRQ